MNMKMNMDIIREMSPDISDGEAKFIVIICYSIPIILLLVEMIGMISMVSMIGLDGVSFMLGGSALLGIPMAYYLELKSKMSGEGKWVNK